MKVTIETEDPNIIGEVLRAKFFKPGGLGCYEIFNLQDDVKVLPDEPQEWFDFNFDPPKMVSDRPEPEYPEFYTVAIKDDVKMRYYWDGDGYLEFILPDGSVIYNSDCKKTWGWRRESIQERSPI